MKKKIKFIVSIFLVIFLISYFFLKKINEKSKIEIVYYNDSHKKKFYL